VTWLISLVDTRPDVKTQKSLGFLAFRGATRPISGQKQESQGSLIYHSVAPLDMAV
jgi:hypothetical protein